MKPGREMTVGDALWALALLALSFAAGCLCCWLDMRR